MSTRKSPPDARDRGDEMPGRRSQLLSTVDPARLWRNAWRIHPSAEVFPSATADELALLAEDIRVNGLKQKPIFWRDKSTDPVTVWVIDGRSRLDAMESLGWEMVDHLGQPTMPAKVGRAPAGKGDYEHLGDDLQGVDPSAVVIAANIRRRHLSKRDQASLLVAATKAGEGWAERKFSPTPGVRGGSTKGITGRVIDQAAKLGISQSTAEKALAEDAQNNDPVKSTESLSGDGLADPEPPPAKPRKQRRGSLPDSYRNAVHDLDKAIRRLERLHADDRFGGNRKELSDRHWRLTSDLQSRLFDLDHHLFSGNHIDDPDGVA